MYEIGRLCVKLAGRDARKKCVVVDIVDDLHVLVDGETRRRKCNLKHLEPLDTVLKIKKGASHDEVKAVLEKEGIKVLETKPKEQKTKPKKVKAVKEKPLKEAKPAKKTDEKPAEKKSVKKSAKKTETKTKVKADKPKETKEKADSKKAAKKE